MYCSMLGCKKPRKMYFFLLIVFGSISSLLIYNFMLGRSWKSFGKWTWRSFMNQKEVELCRQTRNASKSTAVKVLPRLPSDEFYIRMLTARSPPRGDHFDPQINVTELRANLDLVWNFLDMCEQHNITAILYGGSLLGSYRHHGVIPWDDDADVLMDVDDKINLINALKGNPQFRVKLEKRANSVWRVSSKPACFHKSMYGCWPFIEVSFYELQDGWVNDLTSPNYSYPANITFPLHKRPFMGRWVKSPRDTLKFLSFSYKPSDLCISSFISHKYAVVRETPLQMTSCKKLASTYPFVFRVPDSAPSCRGALETLRFYDSGPLYTVPVNEPMGAINTEYSILMQKYAT